MRRFTARFSFEIRDIPAEEPLEAARWALKELAPRLEGRPARRGVWRLFLGPHEIGRVFEVKDKGPA